MRNVRKLTPGLLKRIINEEKQKIARQNKKRKPKSKKVLKERKNAADLKKIKAIKRKQKLLINEIKKTIMQKKLIKKRLLRRL